MPICSYCKQDKKMTREHVIPSFLYAFQKEIESKTIGWNEVVGKMIPGELIVKDVCETCNSDRLSELDSYGKKLLTDCGVLVPNYIDPRLTITYDFDLLLRWLLKISYNSSRTDGAHAALFEPFAPYILGSSSTPKRSQIAMFAYFARPLRSDKDKPIFDAFKVEGNVNTFNPFLVRICYGHLRYGASYTLRMVIFGALMFFILIFHDEMLPGHAASEIRAFLKIRPAVELRPKQRVVELTAGNQSWFDLYKDQIARSQLMKS